MVGNAGLEPIALNRGMNMKTKVNLNASRSSSLRTTIPIGFAEILELKRGDSIKWSLENREGKWILIIEKDS